MIVNSGADTQLSRLVALSQSGDLARLLEESSRALKKFPQDVRLRLTRADALRLLQRWREAALQYEHAAVLGAPQSAQAWRLAGSMWQNAAAPDAAFHAYGRALQLNPADWEVMANLLPLCNKLYPSRSDLPLPAALRLLAHAHAHADAWNHVRAGQVFKAAQCYGLALDSFEKAAHDERIATYARASRLEVEQFCCLWDRVETHAAALLRDVYEQLETVPPLEKNLMHVAWCMDEGINLKVARAGLGALLGDAASGGTAFDHARPRRDGRLRIGYVSRDFYDHPILHLIGGVLARHDRAVVEVFVYDHSPRDLSRYRKRFETSVEHIVDIRDLSDVEAAERIYADGIDVLVDLQGNTAGVRLGIFALKPAPVQVTWLGFPGTSALPQMDYVLSDPVVTPDSSAPFYPEKLCRMPESYQSNDFERPVADSAGTRSDWGLPETGIVFCSFNQSYKIDRPAFESWMEVLRGVPDSVLWVLDPGAETQQHLGEAAARLGVNPGRLVYAPKVPIMLHMARMTLADICLDTRVYNGHTTTSDALWMGVPVLTAPGGHFPSRVSASLLKACDMPELIAADMSGMAQLAIELAHDPEKLAAVKQKLARNRFIAPLYDTDRFARHLERAFTMMAERFWQKLPPAQIDVPALPKRTQPFTAALNAGPAGLRVADFVAAEPAAQQLAQKQIKARLQWAQPQCPLCKSHELKAVNPATWSRPVAGIQESAWAQCTACGHVYARFYWSAEGKAALHAAVATDFPVAACEAHNPAQRGFAHAVASAAVDALEGLPAFLQRAEPARWLDVYGATAAPIAAAQEYGFAPSMLLRHGDYLPPLSDLGVQTAVVDFLTVNFEGRPEVISLLGSLEQEPFPDLLLARAHHLLAPGGVLLAGFDNAGSVQWRHVERRQNGELWQDPRRLHWFAMRHMKRLLSEQGFAVVSMFPNPETSCGLVLVAKKMATKGEKA